MTHLPLDEHASRRPCYHRAMDIDNVTSITGAAEPQPLTSNAPVLSVGQLSASLKRTVEDAYGYVRVRGEISQPKRHVSGHIYLRLKDETAVLEAVCWRGAVSRLSHQPADGMDVIATGRLTTFPGRSVYQLVIEQIELAGEGALLKLLEDRKRRLAAEGLFATERKRPLPYLPRVIGLVTSPSGAVIRDILHRLADRFPRRVLVWPVAVQGDGAEGQISAAIRGFNAIPPDGPVPRPDVIIVARGGGSLEDLMPFNAEQVVRAAAESRIPLISAVGHETDTTLIDLAADVRAPTPTAAAEMAVPVRVELSQRVGTLGLRLDRAAARTIEARAVRVGDLGRALSDPRRLIETHAQRLDDRADRLQGAMRALIERRSQQVVRRAAALRHPRELLSLTRVRLDATCRALEAAIRLRQTVSARALERVTPGLRLGAISQRIESGHARLSDLAPRLETATVRLLADLRSRLGMSAHLLESLSHKGVLGRGYAYVKDRTGYPVTHAVEAWDGQPVTIHFQDGDRPAVIGEKNGAPEPRKRTPKPRAPQETGTTTTEHQQSPQGRLL